MSYEKLNMQGLRALRVAAEQELADAKKQLAGVNAEIESRVKNLANGFGTVHREVDGVQIKITVPKKVEWDQTVLAERYSSIVESGKNPLEYMKVSYDISETAYKNWPSELQDAFVDARTEKAGTMKIEFEGE